MIHGPGTALLLAFSGAAAAPAIGQTSELYISQHNSPRMVVVQGGVVVRSWDTLHAGENALAISGTIRTAANRWSDNGGDGAEYDLSGNALGPVYASPASGNWFDGTTDGRYYSYAVQHNGDHNLYRFDRDWSNPHIAFPLARYSSGVTRDVADETFWVSNGVNGMIYHLDRSGGEIASFDALDGAYAYGLAMDPADGTLWVGGSSSNVIYQFDREGNLLSTVAVEGISTAFGMEFDLPPRECAGDFDDDGSVDTRDLIAYLNAWASEDAAADCDGNGAIDSRDMICFLNAWNEGC
ncbi:MAG TPA: GC-type dockerin domain-anchored protein [Phycisphaerales bacterium]|nr:GC-type dockerin domain-anchored protein [Phycisphaerales bacterium]